MTHQVIRIICYAISPEEARAKAEEILNNNLVGEDKPFDYGTFFDEERSVSGKSRWGNITPVCLADSKEGKKLIDDGMKSTKNCFMDTIRSVRKMIDFYSDEELFEEEVKDTKKKIILSLNDKENDGLRFISLFRYYCYCVGQYVGTEIFLYDQDGEGIRDTKHLKNALDKWGAEKYKGLKIWVIPIDVYS